MGGRIAQRIISPSAAPHAHPLNTLEPQTWPPISISKNKNSLSQLKHFWNQYGNLITWTLILVLGAFAAWNGWNYWQREQAVKASVLYDEVDKAAQSGDADMAAARLRRRQGALSTHRLCGAGRPAGGQGARRQGQGRRGTCRTRLGQ